MIFLERNKLCCILLDGQELNFWVFCNISFLFKSQSVILTCMEHSLQWCTICHPHKAASGMVDGQIPGRMMCAWGPEGAQLRSPLSSMRGAPGCGKTLGQRRGGEGCVRAQLGFQSGATVQDSRWSWSCWKIVGAEDTFEEETVHISVCDVKWNNKCGVIKPTQRPSTI